MLHSFPILAILISSFIIGLTGAMAPGPLLTVTITETARKGFFTSVLLMVGHSLLELVIMIAFLFGLRNLLTNIGVALAVSFLGGGFLIWMAYGILSGVLSGKMNLNLESKNESGSGMHPVFAGILVSISNPFWFVWWASVGAAYFLEARALGMTAIGAFYIGHISSDFFWYCLVGVLVSLGFAVGRQHQMMNSIYRGVMIFCALFLVLMGLKFINNGAVIARTHHVPEFKIERHLLQNHR